MNPDEQQPQNPEKKTESFREVQREAAHLCNTFLRKLYASMARYESELDLLRSGNIEEIGVTTNILKMQKWFRNVAKKIAEKIKFIENISRKDGVTSPIPELAGVRVDLLTIKHAIEKCSFFQRNGLDEATLNEMRDLFILLREKSALRP